MIRKRFTNSQISSAFSKGMKAAMQMQQNQTQQTQQSQSQTPNTLIQATGKGSGDVTFEMFDNNGDIKEVLRLKPNGEIHINGALVDTSRDIAIVVDALKIWSGAAIGLDRLKDQYNKNPEFKELTDKLLANLSDESIMSSELASAAILAARMNQDNLKKKDECDHPINARYRAGGKKIGCYKCSHEWTE